MVPDCYPDLATKHSTAGIAICDAALAICWSNDAFKRMEAQNGEPLRLLVTSLLQVAVSSDTPTPVSVWSDSSNRRWQVIVHPIPSPPAAETSFLIELLPDLGLGSATEPQDTRHASVDSLTGVLSRQGLDLELADRVSQAALNPFALIFLDLDDFKTINDRYGHLEGDACLREVGKRLQQALRTGDVVGRFGGDEFVMLLAGVSESDDLQPIIERLREQIEAPYPAPGGEESLGVSFGWAFSSKNAEPRQLLAEADRAMYAAKRSAL